MNQRIFLLLFLFLPGFFLAQTDTAVVMTYGGDYYDEGFQIIELIDNGFMVVGTTGSNQTTNTDFYLLKLDENFECVWNRTYGSEFVEWGKSIIQDAEGNILLCGYTNGYEALGYDILVIKLNANGDVIWQNTYGGDDWDFADKIVEYPGNGYLVCGHTYSGVSGNSDGYRLWIDQNGGFVQEWFSDSGGTDILSDMVFDGDNLYLLENLDIDGADYTRLEVLDSNLDFIDEYISPDSVHFSAIKFDNTELYLGGYQKLVNHLAVSFWSLHKNDLSVFYSNTDDNGGYFEVFDFIVDSEVILVCRTDVFGLGGMEQLWQERDIFGAWHVSISFGSPYDDTVNGIIRCSDNSVVSVGSLGSDVGTDLLIVRWPQTPLVFDYALTNEYNGCFTVSQEYPDLQDEVGFVDMNGKLHIANEHDLISAHLYDLTGRYLKSLDKESSNILTSGLYFIELIYPEHRSVIKAEIFND